jgi:hypothetical protein
VAEEGQPGPGRFRGLARRLGPRARRLLGGQQFLLAPAAEGELLGLGSRPAGAP